MNELATEGAVEIPLESLPNILDDDTHKYLDEKVLNHFTPLFESFTTLKELEAILLLMGIISESQNRLNPDYETILPAKALLENHPELVDKLRGAWRERSFKEIRNLKIFRPSISIVQVPPGYTAAAGKTKRNITPKEHTVDIEVIDKRIHKELESLRGVVEAFLKDPEPSIWVPPDYVTPSNREFLTNLRIPCYRNGNPSLLFHDLDVCDGNEIKKIFGHASGAPLCICNTSGSGKTRRMLEGLAKYWGFYMVAVRDVNDVGIRDLHDVLVEVNGYEEWISDLSLLPPAQRASQNQVNSLIASKLLKKVLAARIVVFKLFLELAILVDGELQEKHKRIWLLFQLSDSLCGALHPFVQIIRNCLQNASHDALDILVGRLNRIRDNCFPKSQFIVGLDEAQHAARLYPNSFISSTNNEVFRSIIREMATVFTKSSIKLVVSGTGLSLDDLTEAMGSGVSKPSEGIQQFHQLGMFDTWLKLKSFLERYVPATVLESHSGYRLQQRIREYLQGRYRFSVSYLEYFLRNGLESPHRLLNDYIKEHTSCFPGDTGDPFTSCEPELHVQVRLFGFEWDRLRKDSTALQDAAQIVQSHLTRGQSPTFGPVTARLVEYGLARLRERHTGHIVEPLAFLSLMKWLEKQKDVNLATHIRLRLSFQASRGDAYEELNILYLLRTLRYPVPFNTIFDFHTGSTPDWENDMAHIVGRLGGNNVPVDVLGDAPQNPGLGVVHYAASIEEVIGWIETPADTPAVLVTSHLFGPDVMIRCSSSPSNSTVTSTVLLMGQFKSFTDGNKESLDAGTISHGLTSLNRDHWFKQTPSHQRQKLIDAIEKHRVLRFVGGYPLPPDLNLTATSVTQAIEALGPNVTLATIKLDAFKAHFISEGEVGILTSMEHALARKREASEILIPMERTLARKREASEMGTDDANVVKDSAPAKKSRKKV